MKQGFFFLDHGKRRMSCQSKKVEKKMKKIEKEFFWGEKERKISSKRKKEEICREKGYISRISLVFIDCEDLEYKTHHIQL